MNLYKTITTTATHSGFEVAEILGEGFDRNIFSLGNLW